MVSVRDLDDLLCQRNEIVNEGPCVYVNRQVRDKRGMPADHPGAACFAVAARAEQWPFVPTITTPLPLALTTFVCNLKQALLLRYRNMTCGCILCDLVTTNALIRLPCLRPFRNSVLAVKTQCRDVGYQSHCRSNCQ